MSLAGTETPRILIADDEAPARGRLRDLLDDCRESFPLVIVDEARNGREALDVINREKVDIVLLDIRMPEMDGLEAARHIAGMETPPAIIFTTAFDAYALKAFEVNAIDYLLKPVDPERPDEPLDRRLVLGREDAAAVGEPEPGRRRVAVDDGHPEATPARGLQQPELSGSRA